jgi:hypothetical protein
MLCCCANDVEGYLKATGDASAMESALLRGRLKEASDRLNANDPDASTFHALLYLEATRGGDKQLADVHRKALLARLQQGGRPERLVAEMLTDPRALAEAQRVPIEPKNKRVLLAALAQCYADRADEFLALAKRLDFQHDAISLVCASSSMAMANERDSLRAGPVAIPPSAVDRGSLLWK